MRQGARPPGGVVSDTAIVIAVKGAFAVRSAEGVDLTPRGAKACGVLALLALAPERSRGRRWLEEHLWSDRAPGQASGSLRQALTEIRRALGPHAEALRANRKLISVEAKVEAEGPGLLLEGIGVRDARFRAWLARERGEGAPAPKAALAPVAPPSPAGVPKLTILCLPASGGSSAARLGDVVAHEIGEGIAEQVSARRIGETGMDVPADIEVRCDVVENDGVSLAFVRVTHLPSGEVLHTRRCRMEGPAAALMASDALARTAHEAAEIVVGKLPHVLGVERAAPRATALGQLALLRMFTYDAPAMEEADRLLDRAYEADPNGIYLAWRALLQMTRSMELGQAGAVEAKAAAESHMRRAVERGGDNPAVQSLVAQTRVMLFGDVGGALPAAERAAEIGPASPIALQALASAKALAGKGEEAYALSLRARSYADRSRFRHWWDMNHCLVCMVTGRLDEAIAAGEAAAAAAPSYRPAHRQLLALYAHRGDLEGAERMRRALARIEPGFDLARMLGDPDYPVRTLRRTGLLQAVQRIL